MFNWSRRGAPSSSTSALPIATATAAATEDEALAEALRRSIAPSQETTPLELGRMATMSNHLSSQDVQSTHSEEFTSVALSSAACESNVGRENNEVSWACELCTFENPSPASECALCQNPRPVPAVPSVTTNPQHNEITGGYETSGLSIGQGANQSSLDLSAFLSAYAQGGPKNISAHGSAASTTARLEGVLVAPDGARFSVGPLEAPTSALHEHLDALVAAGFGIHEHENANFAVGNIVQDTAKAQGSNSEGTASSRQGHRQKITKEVGPKNSLPVVNLDGTIAGANADDFHVAQPEDQPSILDGNYFRGQAWADIIGRRDQPVGPEQLAPRERVELADRNAQLENSRRKREGSGVEAAASSRYGTRVNPNSSHRGFNDLEGYEQEVWIDPSRNLDQALENPRNRRRGGDNSSTNGAEATPTEAELKTAVLFETAGGLGAKLRNTHLVGGERVKELDFFVASVETPTVVVQPPDPAIAVAQMALQAAVPMPLANSSSSGGSEGTDFAVYVQKELLGVSSSSGSSGSGGGNLTPQCAAACRALRWIVTECCSSKLLALPPEALASVRITYFATMRADSSVACRSETDGLVYFNALVLQQQACFDPLKVPLDNKTSTTTRSAASSWDDWRTWMVPPEPRSTSPIRDEELFDNSNGSHVLQSDYQRQPLATATQRRCWLYWLERTAMVLDHGPPTGLYNKGVRQRFKAMMEGDPT